VEEEAALEYSGLMVVNLTKNDFSSKKDLRDGPEGNAVSDIEFQETLKKEIKFERGFADAVHRC